MQGYQLHRGKKCPVSLTNAYLPDDVLQIHTLKSVNSQFLQSLLKEQHYSRIVSNHKQQPIALQLTPVENLGAGFDQGNIQRGILGFNWEI